MGDPWRARRWREQGTGGDYADMDPAVRPPGGSQPAEAPTTPATEPYPAGASVAAVLAWVGTDQTRASEAHREEMARLPPRSTVLAPLERLMAS